MNLAIEYMIRSGTIKESGEISLFPCSLYLVHIKFGNQKVITIHPKNNEYLITHWELSKSDARLALPSKEEYVISQEELYLSPHVIVSGYRTIRFQSQKYNNRKQRATGVLAEAQEQNYQSLIDNFCNPIDNTSKRNKWLWDIFIRTYMSLMPEIDFAKFCRFFNTTKQKIWISKNKKDIWYKWLCWEEVLCLHQKIAPELIFYEEYESIEKEYLKENSIEDCIFEKPICSI